MAERENKGLLDLSTPVMGTFLNLDEPRRVSQSSKEEPKFSASFEFKPDHPDLARIRAKIVEVASAKWPGRDIGEAIRSGALVVPLTSGDELADRQKAKGKDREWSRGLQVLTGRSQYMPNVGYIENGEMLERLEKAAIVAKKATHFYTGVEVLASLNFVAYDPVGTGGKPGVTAYLQTVISLGRGDKLVKGRTASDAFRGYIGLQSQESVSAGAEAASDW